MEQSLVSLVIVDANVIKDGLESIVKLQILAQLLTMDKLAFMELFLEQQAHANVHVMQVIAELTVKYTTLVNMVLMVSNVSMEE